MKYIYLAIFLLYSVVMFGQVANNTCRVKVFIAPVFEGKPLVLKTQKYVNANGDSLWVDAFRFYLSHPGLNGLNDNNIPKSFHLLDAEDSSTLSFVIDNIQPGVYDSFNFLIGVDSAVNMMGALGADLDPVKGMYWAWNTGYIMAKLEGRSNVCNTLHHAFQFHIGGYVSPNSAARTVTLSLPSRVTLQKGQQITVTIQSDVAQWFYGKRLINLAEINDVVVPGSMSCTLADNYRHMFTVTKVE